jgi:hypothetical protein
MIGVVINFDPTFPTNNIINIKYDIFILIIIFGSVIGFVTVTKNGIEKINFLTIKEKIFLIIFWLINFIFEILIIVPIFLLLIDMIMGTNESECFEISKLLKIAIAAIPYFMFLKKIQRKLVYGRN